MRVYVYTGPTLPHDAGRMLVDAHFLPPIKHGDILDALSEGVECVAIIDGYYETVASVRHKEILQALEAGVHVLGSSSFGALRAAELNAFGMEGVGEIYRMYASGEIEADDEVAVKHAPESEAYKLLSVPLVDLRYNLRRATEAGVVPPSAVDVILNCAQQMYFGDRTFRLIFARAEAHGINRDVIETCKNYFHKHWHDLKRADGEILLKTIAARISDLEAWPILERPRIHRTSLLYRWNVEQGRVLTRIGVIREEEVLAQLKLSTEEYSRVRQLANEGCWLRDYAERLNLTPSDEELSFCRQEFREREQIETLADEKEWLAARALTDEQVAELIETEAYVIRLASSVGEEAPTRSQLLLDYARLCELSARPTEIESEWQRFWFQIKAGGLDADQLFTTRVDVNLAEPPPKQPEPVPERWAWCEQNKIAREQLTAQLSQRALLRKLASNFYIRPAVVYREQVVTKLKMCGSFHRALDELVLIYEDILHCGLSTTWHPQWKVFVQPDTRLIMEWFCREHAVHPKRARSYIKWKGFDELVEFLSIAQLNYINATHRSDDR
jgi:hypothetical protein